MNRTDLINTLVTDYGYAPNQIKFWSTDKLRTEYLYINDEAADAEAVEHAAAPPTDPATPPETEAVAIDCTPSPTPTPTPLTTSASPDIRSLLFKNFDKPELPRWTPATTTRSVPSAPPFIGLEKKGLLFRSFDILPLLPPHFTWGGRPAELPGDKITFAIKDFPEIQKVVNRARTRLAKLKASVKPYQVVTVADSHYTLTFQYLPNRGVPGKWVQIKDIQTNG